MTPLDPHDLLVDRLRAELGDRYIVQFREYPALGAALTQYLVSEIPAFKQTLSDLDAIANNMRTLASDWDFSGASAGELEGLIATKDSLQLQIEYFLTDELSFEVRRALFLQALVAHDLGILNLTPGDSSDVALHFLPPAFVDLFPQVPKPMRTATICLASEAVGERAFFEARRRGSAHIGQRAADLLTMQATRPERYADPIKKALEATTRITHNALRKRTLTGTAREVAHGEGIELKDLLRGEIYQAIAELGRDRDSIDLTVHPEALNIFPDLAINRVVDQFRKQKADKRNAVVVDVDLGNNLDFLPAEGASAETKIDISRLVAAIRDLPERDRRILLLRAEGWPAKEIATAVGMEPATVRQVASRLRRRLRGAG